MNVKVFDLMARVNETRVFVQDVSINVDQMKMYAIESKNGIVMNVSESTKNYLIGVLVKKVTCGILVNMIVSMLKHVKLESI